jgi:hypothetical protein
MTRTMRRTSALLLPLLGAALIAAAGPPWISIEYPANPLDPETRGALVVVHTYHHQAPVPAEMNAQAIALRDGRRISRPLEVSATSRSGVYAIRGDLPGSGAWIVSVTSRSGTQDATALIAMNERREILAVQVPHESAEGGRWMVPRQPTPDEVTELLRTASAMDEAARSTRMASGAGAALLLLVLAPSGAWLALRRRR